MGQSYPTARGPREVRKSWEKDFFTVPPIESPVSENDGETRGEKEEGGEGERDENSINPIKNHQSTIEETIRLTQEAVRDNYLLVARIGVLRDAISACYRTNGPNHHVVCRPIYLQYIDLIQQTNDVKTDLGDDTVKPVVTVE